MDPEPSNPLPNPGAEKQLCVSCMFPNEPQAHFCTKCGAPLTSYAATGPFESMFAEGHVYRQAAERPHRFIVVLGIWLIFAAIAFIGVVMIQAGVRFMFGFVVVGAILISLSLMMIVKTTRNYFAKRQARGEQYR